MLIDARGNYHHDYYQLAIMPLAPALGSLGIVRVVDRYVRPIRREVCVAIVLGLAAAGTFVRHVSAHAGTRVFANAPFEMFEVPSR